MYLLRARFRAHPVAVPWHMDDIARNAERRVGYLAFGVHDGVVAAAALVPYD